MSETEKVTGIRLVVAFREPMGVEISMPWMTPECTASLRRAADIIKGAGGFLTYIEETRDPLLQPAPMPDIQELLVRFAHYNRTAMTAVTQMMHHVQPGEPGDIPERIMQLAVSIVEQRPYAAAFLSQVAALTETGNDGPMSVFNVAVPGSEQGELVGEKIRANLRRLGWQIDGDQAEATLDKRRPEQQPPVADTSASELDRWFNSVGDPDRFGEGGGHESSD